MTALSQKLLQSNGSGLCEQDQSLLFKLPPELREEIWSWTLRAYNDLTRPYDPNSHYWRPGYTHAQKIDLGLLRSCKKVYLEACHLPLSINKITFWCYRGPKGEPDVPQDSRERLGYYEDTDLEEDDTPWHFESFRRNPETPIQFIRSAHWLVQQYWLECDNFLYACMAKEMAHVEHLTVTLRRSDFWNWEQLQPIGLDPRLPVAVTASRMKETWAKESMGGETIPHHLDAWGSHLRHLPHLKRFTLELEGEKVQEAELQAIVDHAKEYWTFRHHSGRFMVAEGNVGLLRWSGPPCLSARRRSFTRVSERPQLVKFALTFALA